MSERRVTEAGGFQRIAELEFSKRTSKLYEALIRDTHDLKDQYSNEGTASAGKYLRKVADAALERFGTLEQIFEDTYIDQYWVGQFGNTPLPDAAEKWLRGKVQEIIDSEVSRAQEVTRHLCSSFVGVSAEACRPYVDRLRGEGSTSRQRINDSITIRMLKTRNSVIKTNNLDGKMAPNIPETTVAVPAIKTLAELKALASANQTMHLLKKLVHIYPMVKSGGGLNKGNLMGPNDPYGFAADFPRSENVPVREFLLGTPWTMLVNQGYLVDPRGSGFYSVSDEGFGAVKRGEEIASSPTPVAVSSGSHDGVPVAFMSYSWDSPEHQEWVLHLAERLQAEGGVKVIHDKWHLRPGSDRTHFMESNITASDFVLVVCTPEYAKKSNARSGGVGYEAMIITSQLATQILQSKFIPALRVGEWGATSQPSWILSKIGVDLRDDPYDEDQYELLLRELHQAPIKPPPIGPKPTFSNRSRIGAPGGKALIALTRSSHQTPNLIFTGVDITPVSGEGSQVWSREMGRREKEWMVEHGQVALLAKFTNEARKAQQNVGGMIKAQIIYRSQDREFRRIGGCWLEAPTDFAEFRGLISLTNPHGKPTVMSMTSQDKTLKQLVRVVLQVTDDVDYLLGRVHEFGPHKPHSQQHVARRVVSLRASAERLRSIVGLKPHSHVGRAL